MSYDDREWDRASRRLFALLREARLSAGDKREARLTLYRWFFSDDTLASTNDLSLNDLKALNDTLAYWKREGRLESEVRTHCGM
jgi:hypothetical protein